MTETVISFPTETELLFSVQAGIRAAIIGYFIGTIKGAKSKALKAKRSKPKQKINMKYLVYHWTGISHLHISFVINSNAESSGTDGQGPEPIKSSGYTPWIHPMGYQPDALGERVLFSFQVSIGGAIIGYFVGYTRAKGQ